jgi:hypothetical protein
MKSLTPKLKQNLHIRFLIYQFINNLLSFSLKYIYHFLEESVLKMQHQAVNAGALILVGYDFDLAS